MRYVIPIDRATVRRNERAGQTTSCSPGIPDVHIQMAFIHPDRKIALDILAGMESLIAFFNGEVTNREFQDVYGESRHVISATIEPTENLDLPKLGRSLAVLVRAAGGRVNEEDCHFEVRVPQHTHRHMPIAPYEFSYLPTEVCCEECGARFPHMDLEYDESCDGECITYSRCPVCGEWDCCTLEMEPLTREIAEAALRAAAEGGCP